MPTHMYNTCPECGDETPGIYIGTLSCDGHTYVTTPTCEKCGHVLKFSLYE